MKLQAFLFLVVALPLYYHCHNTSRNSAARGEQAATEQATQQSQTDPSIALEADSSGNVSVGKTRAEHKNPFGVLIAKTDDQQIPPGKQVQIAKALGANYIRARITVTDWKGSSDAYDQYAAAGFKIILNINYDIPRDVTGDKKPIPFVTDLEAYRKTLNSILDKYKPELAVIENEEDNPGYHSGTAQQYLTQLKTAIEVCHAHGVKVANAGLTNREIAGLVYDDLIRSGKKAEAASFAERAFPERLKSRLKQMYQPNSMVARQLDFGRQVIEGYKTLDLDYVNFHWYEPTQSRGAGPQGIADVQNIDPAVFETVINYVKRSTGKPAITNEFGQLNRSPEIVKQLFQKVLDTGMPYAIWYSADGGEGKAVALQNADGTLRENGVMFRDFIKEHCQ
ncbi:MAG TPA: hypothetical protein VEV83_18210 [Parafilimonas sp.]|nr:hypothetical protein [Parafilimonas sp.]